MAWADVPTKLAQWQAAEYYQTNPDGATSLFTSFGGTYPNLNTIATTRRDDFEARLDHYLNATTNLAASRAIDPKLLKG